MIIVIGLERCHKIGVEGAIAKFQIAKRIEAEKLQNIEEMQKYHSELEKEFKKLLAEVGDDLEFLSVKPADYSFLYLKIDILKEV